MKVSSFFKPVARKFTSNKSVADHRSDTKTAGAYTDKMAGRDNLSVATRGIASASQQAAFVGLPAPAAQTARKAAGQVPNARTAGTSHDGQRAAGQMPRARQAGTYSASQRTTGQVPKARQAGTASTHSVAMNGILAAYAAHTAAMGDVTEQVAQRVTKAPSLFGKFRAYFNKRNS